jgi:hypothetical protein
MQVNSIDINEPWNESEKERIIEKFYFDIPAYKEYFIKKGIRDTLLGLLAGAFPALFCLPCICSNVDDLAHSLYVAVTDHEIIFV